ncbi:hypothetical protein ACLB2K_020912 [Fragaria x ananassa]
MKAPPQRRQLCPTDDSSTDPLTVHIPQSSTVVKIQFATKATLSEANDMSNRHNREGRVDSCSKHFNSIVTEFLGFRIGYMIGLRLVLIRVSSSVSKEKKLRLTKAAGPNRRIERGQVLSDRYKLRPVDLHNTHQLHKLIALACLDPGDTDDSDEGWLCSTNNFYHTDESLHEEDYDTEHEGSVCGLEQSSSHVIPCSNLESAPAINSTGVPAAMDIDSSNHITDDILKMIQLLEHVKLTGRNMKDIIFDDVSDMWFEDYEAAGRFYNYYAHVRGFSTRKSKKGQMQKQ